MAVICSWAGGCTCCMFGMRSGVCVCVCEEELHFWFGVHICVWLGKKRQICWFLKKKKNFLLLEGVGKKFGGNMKDKSASVNSRETPEGGFFYFFYFFLKGITQAGIMLLCIMETDLALLLACMPTVEQCSREGSVGTSTCAESTPHRAVQTLLTSLCIYLFILFCFRFAAFCSTLSVECLWLRLRLERTFRAG